MFCGVLASSWYSPELTLKAASGTLNLGEIKFSPALITSENPYLNFSEY